MKKIALFAGILFLAAAIAFAEEKSEKELVEVKIQTTAECNKCKERIEEAMNELDGVHEPNLDVPSKVLTVKYDPEEIELDEIKEKVSRTGYDADEVKADPRAYKRLPECCKIGGHKKHHTD
jgi:mercuric ion binding protein